MNLRMWKAMNNGKKKDRPEELLVYEILQHHLKNLVEIESQYVIWFNRINYAILDIWVKMKNKKQFAIRVMGDIHTVEKYANHDRMQKYELEERSINVIDAWLNQMPYLEISAERQLDEAEKFQVYNEVKSLMLRSGLHFKKL